MELLRLGVKDDIRSSIEAKMVPFQSSKTALETPALLPQASIQLFRPRIMSSLAFSQEKGRGSRYLGPLDKRLRSLTSETMLRSPEII